MTLGLKPLRDAAEEIAELPDGHSKKPLDHWEIKRQKDLEKAVAPEVL